MTIAMIARRMKAVELVLVHLVSSMMGWANLS